MNKISVIFLFAVLFFTGCSGEDEQIMDPILGSWDARWELINPDLNQVYRQDQRIMNGQVFFDLNQARICAYGFEGCAFKTDTAENILYFRKENGLLNLINAGEHVIFSYRIAEENNNQLKLLLMDDISLTLTR